MGWCTNKLQDTTQVVLNRSMLFSDILSDLNQAVPNHIAACESQARLTFRAGRPQSPFSISSFFILFFVLLPFFLKKKKKHPYSMRQAIFFFFIRTSNNIFYGTQQVNTPALELVKKPPWPDNGCSNNNTNNNSHTDDNNNNTNSRNKTQNTYNYTHCRQGCLCFGLCGPH